MDEHSYCLDVIFLADGEKFRAEMIHFLMQCKTDFAVGTILSKDLEWIKMLRIETIHAERLRAHLVDHLSTGYENDYVVHRTLSDAQKSSLWSSQHATRLRR